jgi:hypothetical protein
LGHPAQSTLPDWAQLIPVAMRLNEPLFYRFAPSI